MRRALSIWLPVYLVACLILSGFAGLSPVLHQLLEHGGRGAAHTHLTGARAHSHDGQHWHTHNPDAPVATALPRAEPRRWQFVHDRRSPDPVEALERMCQQVSLWLPHLPGAPTDDPSPDGEHEHRGLSTLLLSGLADSISFLPAAPARVEVLIRAARPRFLSIRHLRWPSSNPTRGPPAAASNADDVG